MMMRSEAEIRKQVETRLRRWGLVALNGILLIGAAKLIFAYSQNHDFMGSQADVIIALMIGWVALVGLHFLRTVYVELREYLVRRAIDQERNSTHAAYEKPKHDETQLSLSDDGELADFLTWYQEDEYAQRTSDS